MSTFEVDIYARTFFPHLPPVMGRQVASEAVNREVARRDLIANAKVVWRRLVDAHKVELPRNWPFH